MKMLREQTTGQHSIQCCTSNLFYWLGVGNMPIQIHLKRKISQSIYGCNQSTIFSLSLPIAAIPLTKGVGERMDLDLKLSSALVSTLQCHDL